MRCVFAFTVAFSLVALAACGGGSSDSASKGSKKGSDTTQPTGISADDPGCKYIVAGTDSRATNPGPVLQYLTSPVVLSSACYDTVSFTFAIDDKAAVTTTTAAEDGGTASTCSPGYTVEYRKAPFGLVKADGKNVSTSTAGFDAAKAVLYVEMTPAISLSTFPSKPDLAYPGGLRLVFKESEVHHLRIVEWVKNLPEGESTSAPTTTVPGVIVLPQRVVWLIGLDRKRPFTTDCAPGPLPGATCPVTACTHLNVLIMK
ncbi:MAG: hypothetical protein EXQ79_05840 [Acidimicrobiia bacterium]|nr:hypothetical protein [Acidimicrobiia bacterium]